jgi:hypothetical protein
MTEEEKLRTRKSRQASTYTYTMTKLKKDYVHKVNTCLLNEMVESTTFRSESQMLISIRQQRKWMRITGPVLIVLPPQCPPLFPVGLGVKGFLAAAVANLGEQLSARNIRRYDWLEKELKKELNRTHEGREMQTGTVDTGTNQSDYWLAKTDQPAKLSWCRSDREK